MRLGNFEFGIWRYGEKRTIKDLLEVSRLVCHCKCTIYTVSIFYFTILRGSCKKKTKKRKKGRK